MIQGQSFIMFNLKLIKSDPEKPIWIDIVQHKRFQN